MATEQIAVRIPKPMLAELDDLVASGPYESRAAAGIATIVKFEHERPTDEAIVVGYTRRPQNRTEDSAALASLREAILDEPWRRLPSELQHADRVRS